MRVVLRVARCGDGFWQSPGDVVDVPETEASRMIAAGQCAAVDEPPAAGENSGSAVAAAAAEPVVRAAKKKKPA